MMNEHKRSFKNLMRSCVKMSNEEAAKKIYRPIERDLMRLDREQTKLKEAYRIIDDQHHISDITFANRLFIYHNE